MKRKKIIKPPKRPLVRILQEGNEWPVCHLCHSSLKWKWYHWLFSEDPSKSLGCLQPKCDNYYKKNEVKNAL